MSEGGGHADKQVQKTNDYSSVSKQSMCAAGYVNDPFFRHFVGKKVKRAPIINRGYYVRMQAVDTVVLEFLNNACESLCAAEEAGSNGLRLLNIIVLGAGYDTLFFRLHAQQKELMDQFDVRCVEIDFLDVCTNKSLMIQEEEELKDFLTPPTSFQTENFDDVFSILLEAKNYVLVGFDLRKSACLKSVFKKLDLNSSAPTLVLGEVVLTYMEDTYVCDIFRTMSSLFHNALFVNYEQVLPTDSFGRLMLQHFEKQSTPLMNVHRYPTVHSHMERFLNNGWNATVCLSVAEFWTHFIPEEEKTRIDVLEPFDEHEEFIEKMRHYVLALAATGDCYDVIETFRPPSSNEENLKIKKREEITVKIVPAVFLPNFSEKNSKKNSEKKLQIFSEKNEKKSQNLQNSQNCFLPNFFAVFGHAAAEVKLLKRSGEAVHVVVLVGGVPQNYGSKPKPSRTEAELSRAETESSQAEAEPNGEEEDRLCPLVDLGPGLNGIWISSAQLDPSLKRPLVHHAVIVHSATSNVLFVIGGRTSPRSPNVSVYTIELKLDEFSTSVFFTVKKGSKTALLNSERNSIRCQAVPLLDDDEPGLALAVQSLSVESQLSTLDYLQCEMNEDAPRITLVPIDTTYPACFGSCALWGLRRVVLTGGIRDDVAVSTIFSFDTKSDDWPYLGRMTFPRFGHTSHTFDDYLILIGGVSHLHQTLPDITVFHLLTKKEKHFKLQFPLDDSTQKEPLVMLFNHTSILISRNEPKRIMVFGGGGNCFSFGTHFNTFPFFVELASIL